HRARPPAARVFVSPVKLPANDGPEPAGRRCALPTTRLSTPLVSLGVVQEMRAGCCFPVDPRPPSVQHPLQAFPHASTETPASGELSWFKSRLDPVANSQTPPGGRTMTIDRMTLKALIEKGPDDDLLREM